MYKKEPIFCFIVNIILFSFFITCILLSLNKCTECKVESFYENEWKCNLTFSNGFHCISNKYTCNFDSKLDNCNIENCENECIWYKDNYLFYTSIFLLILIFPCMMCLIATFLEYLNQNNNLSSITHSQQQQQQKRKSIPLGDLIFYDT